MLLTESEITPTEGGCKTDGGCSCSVLGRFAGGGREAVNTVHSNQQFNIKMVFYCYDFIRHRPT